MKPTSVWEDKHKYLLQKATNPNAYRPTAKYPKTTRTMASNPISFSSGQLLQLFNLEQSRILASTAAAKSESNARMAMMQEEFKARIAIMHEESKARIAILEEGHKAETMNMQNEARTKAKQGDEFFLMKSSSVRQETENRINLEKAESAERIKKIRLFGTAGWGKISQRVGWQISLLSKNEVLVLSSNTWSTHQWAIISTACRCWIRQPNGYSIRCRTK